MQVRRRCRRATVPAPRRPNRPSSCRAACCGASPGCRWEWSARWPSGGWASSARSRACSSLPPPSGSTARARALPRPGVLAVAGVILVGVALSFLAIVASDIVDYHDTPDGQALGFPSVWAMTPGQPARPRGPEVLRQGPAHVPRLRRPRSVRHLPAARRRPTWLTRPCCAPSLTPRSQRAQRTGLWPPPENGWGPQGSTSSEDVHQQNDDQKNTDDRPDQSGTTHALHLTSVDRDETVRPYAAQPPM